LRVLGTDTTLIARSIFNRDAKKAFSVEFIEDNSETELKRRIEQMSAADWQFFFNNPPSDAVKRELASVLG